MKNNIFPIFNMKLTNNRWFVEGIWIVSSFAFAFIILLPIQIYNIKFPFITTNIAFIVGFSLFCRWIFLWKFTPYAWSKILKLVLIFIFIPLTFVGINKFYDFRIYLDEIGLQELVPHLGVSEQTSMILYMRNEMIFFGTSFIITASIIPFIMIWSIWKQYNRNEV
ncbi:MAG: hypothetical protein IPO78_03425 [Saprospiraceae bacterium]|nr:hypothetical protein [Saprospiraceae bacterium]